MAGPLPISREEYRRLKKGAIIEIDFGNKFHLGYFDHIDDDCVYMGNPTERNGKIDNIKPYKISEIQDLWLHHQYAP